MKTIIFLAIIGIIGPAVANAAADSEFYNLEKLDYNKLANNDYEEFQKLVNCLLDREECTKLYGTYRAITAEAVEQNCKRCSPYQKNSFWQFLQKIIAKYPKDYENFKRKYDPENKYFETLESELKKYSVAD